MQLVQVKAQDAWGWRITLVWFNQPWVLSQIEEGATLIVTGRVGRRNGLQLYVEHFEDEGTESLSTGRIVPIYPAKEGVSQAFLRRTVHRALELALPLPDPLEAYREDLGLMPYAEALKAIHFPEDEEALKRELGVEILPGEEGYAPLERLWARPTLDPNGIWGGYQGEGSKTVIPAEAGMKLSMRLVPDQDPEEVADQAEAYLKAVCPPGYALEVRRLHGGRPVLTDPFSPPMRLMARALEEVWGRPPVYTREGGTIPVVAELKETLGAPIVLLGLGLPDDNLHAPNEKLDLVNLEKGVEVIRRFHRLLAG